MDRPVMDPTYSEDPSGASTDPMIARLWRAMAPLWRIAKIALRVLVWNPLVRRRDGQFRNEDGTTWQRVWRGIFYRVAFLPFIIAMLVAMCVWASTHPRYAAAAINPNARGVYYETVKLKTLDATTFQGWLIPQVDARKILDEGEKVIRRKHPAVVLIPEPGRGAEEHLPLLQALYDAGFVVLAINSPRTSMLRSHGITFGLREANEVQAAVAMLRTKSFIDPRRIALIGVGGGANAAFLSAKRDATLRAIVAERPYKGASVLREKIGPTKSGFQWMQPLCKWGFELGYQVDAEELDLKNYEEILTKRHVLMISEDDVVTQTAEQRRAKIIEFLSPMLKK